VADVADLYTTENPVQAAERRKAALWLERDSWISHYKEISEYQMPRAGRYFVSDSNKGTKRHNSIFDNTVLFSSRTLSSGLMSGMTSPARQWFRLTLPDKKLAAKPDVKQWLHQCAELIRAVFASSNTYRALASMYEELGPFGTSVSIMLPDFDNVVHHYPLTVGSYALGTDHKGRVDTLVREMQMTAWQIVGDFGIENCSQAVKSSYLNKSFDTKYQVNHIITPRRVRDVQRMDAKNMRFMSCYYEPSEAGNGIWLRESGYRRFPVLAPRWSVVGEDVYGQSPGMECLGDVKQLQHEQLRKSQCIDYQTNPPLQVPTTLQDNKLQRLPGGESYYDQTVPSGGIRSAFDVQLNLQHLAADMEEVRQRIRGAYYADLFLMLANDRRSGTTATEIAERHEEKLLMLGPVLERMHNELLSPMIDMTFDYCAEARILPPPPPELRGLDIDVEFISTLAQAQRMVAAGGLDRLLTTVGNMANRWPESAMKIDPLKAIESYSDMFGTDPAVIVPDDVVAERQAAAQAQAAAQQMAAAAPGLAGAAKDMSQVDAPNMRDVMNSFTGYGSPSAQEVGA
jgi:hypothetical protein